MLQQGWGIEDGALLDVRYDLINDIAVEGLSAGSGCSDMASTSCAKVVADGVVPGQ